MLLTSRINWQESESIEGQDYHPSLFVLLLSHFYHLFCCSVTVSHVSLDFILLHLICQTESYVLRKVSQLKPLAGNSHIDGVKAATPVFV